jgi:hypothetical protein
MTSGQDASEYLDTLGLEKKSKKKMSWCSDAPEDESISLFARLLAKPDVPLNTHLCGLLKKMKPHGSD